MRERERESILKDKTSELETSKRQLESLRKDLGDLRTQLKEKNKELEQKHLTGECDKMEMNNALGEDFDRIMCSSVFLQAYDIWHSSLTQF